MLAFQTLMIRKFSWAVMAALLVSSVARADDDDLLAAPVKKKAPPAKAPAKAPPAKKAPAKKPVVNDDDLLAAPTPAPAPQKGKTEVVVKLAREVKRAHLFIDDKDVGAFPVDPQEVTPGAHTLQVKAPAHATWTKKVTVAAGKTLPETATLEATAALLSVSSDVVGADVFVNGKSVGTTPVEDAEVPAGNIEVLVKKHGYKDGVASSALVKGRETSLTVKLTAEEPVTTTIVAQNGDRPEQTNLTPANLPDETTNVSTTTVKPEPITSKWYFWAGAAAVVVAVGVGVGVGVNQANQSKSLDEKAICGGKCDACIGFACSGLLPLPMGPR